MLLGHYLDNCDNFLSIYFYPSDDDMQKTSQERTFLNGFFANKEMFHLLQTFMIVILDTFKSLSLFTSNIIYIYIFIKALLNIYSKNLNLTVYE